MNRLIIPGTPPSIKYIPLNHGKYAIVDEDDYEYLSKFRWRYAAGYAVRFCKESSNRSMSMHREIMGCPENLFVDHINGNGLDNRKANLRICSHKQNNRNRAPHKRKCSSKYKGVCWSKNHGKWVSRIIVDNKQIFLGYFDDEVLAAMAYNEAAIKYYGDFARLNEIHERGWEDETCYPGCSPKPESLIS